MFKLELGYVSLTAGYISARQQLKLPSNSEKSPQRLTLSR